MGLLSQREHYIFILYIVQSAGAVEYTEGQDPTNHCPVYDTKQSDGWGPINAWTLENTDPPFIAIIPRFTLVRRGSTW